MAKLSVLLLALLALLLPGCSASPAAPPLAVSGQPTLVFVYTDN